MLEIVMPTAWSFFAVYAAWYFTWAKHCAPLTLNEARVLWKIHKQHTQCKSRKWNEIRHDGKIIGFECACGYKHVQKRLVVG